MTYLDIYGVAVAVAVAVADAVAVAVAVPIPHMRTASDVRMYTAEMRFVLYLNSIVLHLAWVYQVRLLDP